MGNSTHMPYSFKDFIAVNYKPGQPDIIGYQAIKRKKELAGSDVAESSDEVDAKKEPAQVPAEVQDKNQELDEVDMSTKASQASQHLFQNKGMSSADAIRGHEQAITLHNSALLKHYKLARLENPGSEKHKQHMGKVSYHYAQGDTHRSALTKLNTQALKK